MSNGEQTEEINNTNIAVNIAESRSKNFSTYPLVHSSNYNKDLEPSIVNNDDVIQNDIIHQEYVFARKQGISKNLYFRVINEIKNKTDIKILSAYIHGAINNITNHIAFRNGTRTYDNPRNQWFYEWSNK